MQNSFAAYRHSNARRFLNPSPILLTRTASLIFLYVHGHLVRTHVFPYPETQRTDVRYVGRRA